MGQLLSMSGPRAERPHRTRDDSDTPGPCRSVGPTEASAAGSAGHNFDPAVAPPPPPVSTNADRGAEAELSYIGARTWGFEAEGVGSEEARAPDDRTFDNTVSGINAAPYMPSDPEQFFLRQRKSPKKDDKVHEPFKTPSSVYFSQSTGNTGYVSGIETRKLQTPANHVVKKDDLFELMEITAEPTFQSSQSPKLLSPTPETIRRAQTVNASNCNLQKTSEIDSIIENPQNETLSKTKKPKFTSKKTANNDATSAVRKKGKRRLSFHFSDDEASSSDSALAAYSPGYTHPMRRSKSVRKEAVDTSPTETTESSSEKEDNEEAMTILRAKGMLKPPKFDNSYPFETFLAQFRTCADHNGWNESDKLAYLRHSLDGDVANVLWSYGAEVTKSFSGLKKTLKSLYGGKVCPDQHRIELRCRRRGEDETIQSVHSDIRRLAALAYPHADRRTRDIVACDCFLEALADPDLALKIRERQPKDLDSALHIAIQLETWLTVSKSQSFLKDEDESENEIEENQDLSENESENENVEGIWSEYEAYDSNEEEKQSESIQLTCWRCGGPHVVKQCPFPKTGREKTKYARLVKKWVERQGIIDEKSPVDMVREASEFPLSYPQKASKEKKYITVVYKQERRFNALLDRSCPFTVASPELAEAFNWEIRAGPKTGLALLIDGVSLAIIGEAQVRLRIGKHYVDAVVQIVPKIEGFIFGRDELLEDEDEWIIDNGKWNIDGNDNWITLHKDAFTIDQDECRENIKPTSLDNKTGSHPQKFSEAEKQSEAIEALQQKIADQHKQINGQQAEISELKEERASQAAEILELKASISKLFALVSGGRNEAVNMKVCATQTETGVELEKESEEDSDSPATVCWRCRAQGHTAKFCHIKAKRRRARKVKRQVHLTQQRNELGKEDSGFETGLASECEEQPPQSDADGQKETSDFVSDGEGRTPVLVEKRFCRRIIKDNTGKPSSGVDEAAVSKGTKAAVSSESSTGLIDQEFVNENPSNIGFERWKLSQQVDNFPRKPIVIFNSALRQIGPRQQRCTVDSSRSRPFSCPAAANDANLRSQKSVPLLGLYE